MSLDMLSVLYFNIATNGCVKVIKLSRDNRYAFDYVQKRFLHDSKSQIYTPVIQTPTNRQTDHMSIVWITLNVVEFGTIDTILKTLRNQTLAKSCTPRIEQSILFVCRQQNNKYHQ